MKKFQDLGHQPFPAKGHQTLEQKEIRGLTQELKRVTMEREILKKQLGSSRNHPNEIPSHRSRELPGRRYVRFVQRKDSGYDSWKSNDRSRREAEETRILSLIKKHTKTVEAILGPPHISSA